MKTWTFDEIRDAIYDELVQAFPGERIYDLGKITTFTGQQFVDVELPCITYSLLLTLDYSRVVDELTEIDEAAGVGRVTELIPYRALITIACHSELQKEAEALSHRIHTRWGHAPCFAGIGCRLNRVDYADATETNGVYSYEYSWVGWVRLAGRTQEAPLLRTVRAPVDVKSGETLEEEPPPQEEETPEEESPPQEGGTPEGESPPAEERIKVVVFEVGEETV